MVEACWGPRLAYGSVHWTGPLSFDAWRCDALGGGPEGAESGARRVRRPLLLDTETTGLAGGAGTLAFLIGMAWWEAGAWRMEQLFLRSPAEEPPLLRRLADRLADADALVTFNGRRFDWPLLRTRCLLHRVPVRPPPVHLDLLSPARRLLNRSVPDVRLQTLERTLCGVVRSGDVPGRAIPSIYRAWLRGGGAALTAVFEHNERDLRALGALALRLDALVRGLWEEPSGFGGLGVARWLWRRGERSAAMRRIERVAREGVRGEARFEAWEQLGRWWRGLGDIPAARRAFEAALAEAPDARRRALAHLRLARLLEHRGRSPRDAWPHALASEGAEEAWRRARRLRRLRRKLEGESVASASPSTFPV